MRKTLAAALLLGAPLIATSQASAGDAYDDTYYERPAYRYYYSSPRVYRDYDEPRVVRRYYYYGPRTDRDYYHYRDGWW
jgi:hypothetical protein